MPNTLIIIVVSKWGTAIIKHCQIGRHLSWMQRNNVTENNIVFFLLLFSLRHESDIREWKFG